MNTLLNTLCFVTILIENRQVHTAKDCFNCVGSQYQVNRNVPENIIYNERNELDKSLPSAAITQQHDARLWFPNQTNSIRNDANGRSIYSSLVKIIYQLRSQLEHDKLRSRADTNNQESGPNKDHSDPTIQADKSKSKRFLAAVNQQAANITDSSNKSETVILDVVDEPLSNIQDAVVGDRFESGRSVKTTETKDVLFKPTNAPIKLMQQIPATSSTTFSPIFNPPRFSPKDTTRRSSSGSFDSGTDYMNNHDEIDEPADNDKSLFTFSSSDATRNFKINRQPHNGDDFKLFGAPSSVGYSRTAANNYDSNTNQAYSYPYHRRYGQKALQSAAAGGMSPLRASEYFGSSSDISEQQEQDDYLSGSTRISTGARDTNHESNKWPRLNPHHIHLQQVYPTPATFVRSSPSSGGVQSNQPSRDLHGTSLRDHADTRVGDQMSSAGPTLAAFEALSSAIQPQQFVNQQQQQQAQSSQTQRDLVNQPQTIQITAVPTGLGLNNNPLIRINGIPQVGQFQNGLWNNGLLDPFGRQVLMVNAERRQIDWSVWIWPMLALVTLPLVLGALFVPVFLKTIVVLIQILQSLGLLLPMANALGQQVVQTSGLTTATAASQQQAEQMQKFNSIT